MKCPKCGKEMDVVNKDVSFNTKKGNKEYVRTLCVCKDDDIWVNIEIPKVV